MLHFVLTQRHHSCSSASCCQVTDLEIEADASYDGPHYTGSCTPDFCQYLMTYQTHGHLLPKKYAKSIILDTISLLKGASTLVEIDVPKEGKITVCGDIHGQFYDLLKIFYLNNLPSEQNPYVFNGDFVHRGHFSTEVVLTLFAWKLALPNHIHLNRGNHETAQINGFYGFKQEVVDKYGENLYDLFCEAFRLLPLCHLINGAVFVVHGGLFSKDDVTLKDIRKLNRYCEPKGLQGSEALICDMLWSDPQHCQGRAPSKRGGCGVGIAFGPDVTERFLLKNSLKMIIRSHEKKRKGYEIAHNGKLITVHGPSTDGRMRGAYINLDGTMTPTFTSFDQVTAEDIHTVRNSG